MYTKVKSEKESCKDSKPQKITVVKGTHWVDYLKQTPQEQGQDNGGR